MAMMGKELLEELGETIELPDGITSFELRIAVDELVTVTIESIPTIEGTEFASILKKYELSEIGGD